MPQPKNKRILTEAYADGTYAPTGDYATTDSVAAQVPPLVTAAIAADGTIAAAVGAAVPDAVSADIAGRDLIDGEDDRAAQVIEAGLGYGWVVTDLNDRVAIGVRPDGSVDAKVNLPDGSIALSKLGEDVPLPEETATASAVWEVTDQAGRSALWITPDGSVSWAKVTGEAKSKLGIIAPRTVPEPSWSTKVGDWNPEKATYNLHPRSLQNWNAALARAAAGVGTAHISTFIDSETYGAAATGASQPKWLNSWPGRLRRKLDASLGYASGTGIAVPWNTVTALPADDPRWAFGAGAAQLAGAATATPHYGAIGRGAIRLTNNTGTGYLEFTPVGNVDRITVYAVADSGASGLATVKVDGSSVGTFDVSAAGGGGGTLTRKAGTPAGVIVIDVTGLASGPHTVRIEGPAASTVTIWGVDGGTGKGVRVSNLARSSCAMSHMILDEPAGNTYGMGLHIDTADADLSLLMLGLNDRAVAPATFKANVTTAIARIRVKGGDVLLVIPGQPDYTNGAVGPSSLVPMATAMYELSDSLDVPVLDLAWVRKDFATANALGLYADGIHSNDTGLEHHARFIFNAITGV